MPKEAHYDGLSYELAHTVRPVPPAQEAVDKAAARLDSMLAQALHNFEVLDRKATLVPVALAAVLTFVASRPVSSAPSWIEVTALLLVGAASGLAIWSFSASRYRSGPNPIALAQKTHRHPIAQSLADQGVVDSLAVAVEYATDLQDVKAVRLNLSLIVGVVAVIFLSVVLLVGGP